MGELAETYTRVLDTVIQLNDLEYEAGELRNKVIQLEAEKRNCNGRAWEPVVSEVPLPLS